MMLVAWSFISPPRSFVQERRSGNEYLKLFAGSCGHIRAFSGQTAAHSSRIADPDSVLIGTFYRSDYGFRNEIAGALARLSPQTKSPGVSFPCRKLTGFELPARRGATPAGERLPKRGIRESGAQFRSWRHSACQAPRQRPWPGSAPPG